MRFRNNVWAVVGLLFSLTALLATAGCAGGAAQPVGTSAAPGTEQTEIHEDLLRLPVLEPAQLDGQPLQVVATTSIIGDVVAQVGGDAIALTTLIAPGQDPHSYEPAARDLAVVEEADVIFVNGWALEEGLLRGVVQVGQQATIVPISAGIEPLVIDEAESAPPQGQTEAHGHGADIDPHVWFDVENVRQWVDNVAVVLSTLDPANTELFAGNARAYQASLTDLETYADAQLARIPAEQRYLVTNHDAFGYFAEAYGFTIVGTVIPAASTLAEPSANELVQLISTMEAHNLCTIFSETTVSDTVAQTVASELSRCEQVSVIPLYVGSVGDQGSYINMYRANVDRIVEGLS